MQQQARSLCSALQSADCIRFTADLTADYGERLYNFRLDCECTENNSRVTVLLPENISGITAVRAPGSSTLEYEGVILDTGDLSGDGLSPMNGPDLIISAWRSCPITQAMSAGRDLISVTNTVTDETEVITVFDVRTSLPVSADVEVDGRRRVSCTFYDVTVD